MGTKRSLEAGKLSQFSSTNVVVAVETVDLVSSFSCLRVVHVIIRSSAHGLRNFKYSVLLFMVNGKNSNAYVHARMPEKKGLPPTFVETMTCQQLIVTGRPAKICWST